MSTAIPESTSPNTVASSIQATSTSSDQPPQPTTSDLQVLTEAADDYLALLQVQEDLNSELVPYIEHGEHFTCLKHPLVNQLFYTPLFNAVCNRMLAYKQEAVVAARASANWESYIWLHERPYRLPAFNAIRSNMSDEDYWRLLRSVLIDSENLWQYKRLPLRLLRSKRPGRQYLMTDKEHALFDSLPEQFIVYRGHTQRNRLGSSWTLSRGIATWFARRFDDIMPHVSRGIARKADVMAVFLGRQELEVVVDTKRLGEVTSVYGKCRISLDLVRLAESAFKLGSRSIHGRNHWSRVADNGHAICALDSDIDATVVHHFALLHDCKRLDDDDDPGHGRRAAGYCKKLHSVGKLQLTQSQLRTLIIACAHHNDGQTSDDRTIGACWDADRLDLTRIGVIPDLARLSTTAGRAVLWQV